MFISGIRFLKNEAIRCGIIVAVYTLSQFICISGIRFLKNEAIRCGIIVVVYTLS